MTEPWPYDAITAVLPGHVTYLRSNRREGAWGGCSCGWMGDIGFMGAATDSIRMHLQELGND